MSNGLFYAISVIYPDKDIGKIKLLMSGIIASFKT